MNTSTQEPQYEASFFTTIRSWNITRGRNGVFGGVVEGVGDRISMERGPARLIAVVLFLITSGFFLTAYAAGWALLPDHKGRIIAQDFGRGTPNVPAIIGIGVLGLIGLSGFGWYWPAVGGLGVLLAGLFGIVVIVGVVALIGWAIARDPDGHGRYVVEFRATKEAKEAAQNAKDSAKSAAHEARDAAKAAGVAVQQAGKAAGEQAKAAGKQAKDSAVEAGRKAAAQATSAAAELRDAVVVKAAPADPADPFENPRARYTPRAWTPGPGQGIYLLVFAAAVLSAAAIWWLDRNGELAHRPEATWLAVLVIIVGCGIILTGLVGRRIGFLGFLATVLIVSWSLVLVATPTLDRWFENRDGTWYDEIHNDLVDWGIVDTTASPSVHPAD